MTGILQLLREEAEARKQWPKWLKQTRGLDPDGQPFRYVLRGASYCVLRDRKTWCGRSELGELEGWTSQPRVPVCTDCFKALAGGQP